MIALITLLVLVLTTMSAQAVEPRAISNKPNLSFSSTTAHCSAVCTGAGSSDKVEATLTLYQEQLMWILGVILGKAVSLFLENAQLRAVKAIGLH